MLDNEPPKAELQALPVPLRNQRGPGGRTQRGRLFPCRDRTSASLLRNRGARLRKHEASPLRESEGPGRMKHANVSIGTRQLGAVFDEFLARKPAQITIGQAGGLEAMDFYGEIPRGPL